MAHTVYKIVDREDNILYYGHTKDLKRRTYQHQYSFRKLHKKPLYDYLHSIDYTEEDIILIPLFEYKTKAQAKRKEIFLILSDYFSNEDEKLEINLYQKIPNISDR